VYIPAPSVERTSPEFPPVGNSISLVALVSASKASEVAIAAATSASRAKSARLTFSGVPPSIPIVRVSVAGSNEDP
jgi:hypothetical protein